MNVNFENLNGKHSLMIKDKKILPCIPQKELVFVSSDRQQ